MNEETKLFLNEILKEALFNEILYESCYSREKALAVMKLVLYADKNLTGDLAECGVWRAGGTILMAEILKKRESDKHIFAFDSFEGLPKPTKFDRMPDGYIHYTQNRLVKTSIETVQTKANHYKVKEYITFVKGFFRETLQKTIKDNRRFSLIVIDPDQYSGTKFCLEFFYPKMVDGGIIIIDDYFNPISKKQINTPGVKIATDEYLKNKSEKPLHLAETMYFLKTKGGK